MSAVSTSPLRYFQKKGNGRHGARDYKALGREDPFRNGQISFRPRIGFKINTVENMISKPSKAAAELRNFY